VVGDLGFTPPAERFDHGGIHESARVVLASSDPSGVTRVIRLSRASYRQMLQNLNWVARYNVIAIPSLPVRSPGPASPSPPPSAPFS
jgi:hypothetical protein